MCRKLRCAIDAVIIPAILGSILAFLIPAGLTVLISKPERKNAIVWNKIAIFTNGTIIGHEIVNYTVAQKCNPNCVGACVSCHVMYYDAYVELAYLSYIWRYLCYHGYSNRTALELALKEYQSNGTKIGLYYNSQDPRDVLFHLLPITGNIVMIVIVAFVYLVALAVTIMIVTAYWNRISKRRNEYESIPEAPEPIVPQEHVSLTINSDQTSKGDITN